MKKVIAMFLALAMVLGLAACGSSGSDEPAPETEAAAVETEAAVPETDVPAAGQLAETTIYIDVAKSLEACFEDVIIPAYAEVQPNVTIIANYGGSGGLLTGIEEANGVNHDIFFSAGKAQVTTLNETDGLVVEGSVVELLSNQLCLVCGNGVETAVTGFENLNEAESFALADGTVPVGKYSRIALINLGFLDEIENAADYTSDQISAALGVTIDECADVEEAAMKAVEHSDEIATIYYSDYYNHQDDLTIIAQDDGTLTGPIIYPVCQVANPEADEAETAAAADFLAFLQTQVCLDAYEEYCFIING